jgi:AraC-like DNA-binding protein
MAAILERPARRHWSTADVDSRHALAYWADTICKSFLEIDIDSLARDRFRARLDTSQFGPAMLHFIEADRQTIRRTPARIAHSRYDGYLLMQMRAGQRRFQQHDRESRIEVGDCVLIDCAAPYRVECLTRARSIALHFSREWLRNWLPTPEVLAGRPFRSGSGWSNALCAALASLDTDWEEELALPEGVVVEQIAALLALAAGPSVRASRGSEKLLNRIRRTMRDRCHEARVTPAAIADSSGISKRYLHHLFAQAGTTFGNELMRMRLDCAHRLLSDTRYAALTVTEVFLQCGFQESSHFARRFRKAYGVGPMEFRAVRLRRRCIETVGELVNISRSG